MLQNITNFNPGFRIEDKQSGQQVLSIRGDLVWRCEISLNNLLKGILNICTLERQRPTQKRIQDTAQTPQVCLQTVGYFLYHLRRYIIRRAAHSLPLLFHRLQLHCATKIDELDVIGIVDEYVAQLEITVHDASLLHVKNSFSKLGENAGDFCFFNSKSGRA